MDVRQRLTVQRQIKGCTSCELHKRCKAPVPFRGPTPTTLAVVGEGPGEQEDQQGKPFVGPAGILLDTWLTDVRIDPTSVFVCNTVCCRPRDARGKNRAPSLLEQLACRDNLAAQLQAAAPEFVLILGATALSVWWPKLKISEVHGYWWEMTWPVTTYAMATFHPAAVLRGGHKADVATDLEYMALSVVEGWGRHGKTIPAAAQWCVKCQGEATTWVSMLPFCDTHVRFGEQPDPAQEVERFAQGNLRLGP